MKEKIKILAIGNKKIKREEANNWQKIMDRYTPDMYDTSGTVGAEEGIKQVINLRPEIILLNNETKDTLDLLKKIKQLHPPAAIFVFLNMIDDEQETIDEYMAAGAYKCYLPPVIIDTLVHDMYVALNLE